MGSISTITEPDLVDATGVTITLTGTNIVIAWSAPAENGSPLLGYEVLWASTSSATPTYVKEVTYCGSSLAMDLP